MLPRILRRLIPIKSPTNLIPTTKPAINLFRHIKCAKKGPFYNCRIAYQSDYDKVMNFMMETYLKTEPSIVNIGNGLAEHTDPVLINLMRMNIQEGMTIIIEDTLYNCVVGAAVNVKSHPHDPDKAEKIANCCDCKPARDLIKFFAFCSRQTDLWNVFCVPTVFECAHVAVHPDHQGKGLAKKLIEESWILARDTAYRVFRIDCSSVYTAQIAEGFSWKNIYSIPYRRYFHEGDFVFKCIQEPHTEMRIFVDRINQYTRYHPIYQCKRK